MRSTSRNIICEKQPFGGGRRAVFLCAGMGSFAPPGASSFLSSLKESYQRKPLETTFQDFLGAGRASANLAVCTRGRGAAVITVGQKDCACVHRRGGFRDRLPSHGRGICFYRVGGVSPPRRRAGVAPAGAGWGVSCSGTSNFLLLSKESYQRKPLKPTV